MIRIRRGIARSVHERRPGLLDVGVQIDGASEPMAEPAIAYPDLCGPVRPGDRVVLNTTAKAAGLGTGGVHFVIAVEGGADTDAPAQALAMKWRYTPLQVPIEAFEESGALMPQTLDGMPVVAAGLHSAIAPVVIAARATTPDVRIGLVLTDGAALPLAFSDTVAALRDAGLLHVTVTCGQAFGGDVEAVNKFSGMLAAKAAGAQVVVVAMGPGNLGTASRYGFATMEVAEIVNATAALGGSPIVVPRISFADAHERHQGVSHHTLTALSATFAPARIAIPRLDDPGRMKLIHEALRPAAAGNEIVEIDIQGLAEKLTSARVPLESMGRTFADDPAYFLTAAAAGVLAAKA